MLTAKNILITGAAGFVGAHLTENLVDGKLNLITVDKLHNPRSYFFQKKLAKKTTFVKMDICDFKKLKEIVCKYKIDFIFHLAAQTLVEDAFADPKKTLNNNIISTINILESCRLNPRIQAVIIASSDKAYGKLKKKKYQEDDALRGDHPYEVSKSATDLIAQTYFKTYGVPTIVTRFGNIYGEGDLNFSRLIPGIMEAIIKNKCLLIRSNGHYIRDYLYVKDVVNGYLTLMANATKIKGEIYNFGSKETLSIMNVVRIVEKTINKKIAYKILNKAKNEIFYQSLDYSKIKKKLGWQPKYLLTTSITSVFHWYKDYFLT